MKTSDYLKAIRKADREMEIELMGKWSQKTKIHKSKKAYDRKNKNKFEIE